MTVYDEARTGETAVTEDEAWKLANHWVAAWNAHDLDLIMTHYEDAVELTSPAAARLLGTPDGKVAGKANLRAYFQRGLKAYPELQFRLEDMLYSLWSFQQTEQWVVAHVGFSWVVRQSASALG